MGSETTFLMRLQQEDYRMVWCPDVVVEHRVCRQELVPEKIIRRGFSFGRGKIYCSGIARSKLFTASPRLWFVCEVILLVGAMFRYLLNYLRVNSARRIHGTIGASRAIGFHLESLKRKGIPSAWGKEAKG